MRSSSLEVEIESRIDLTSADDKTTISFMEDEKEHTWSVVSAMAEGAAFCAGPDVFEAPGAKEVSRSNHNLIRQLWQWPLIKNTIRFMSTKYTCCRPRRTSSACSKAHHKQWKTGCRQQSTGQNDNDQSQSSSSDSAIPKYNTMHSRHRWTGGSSITPLCWDGAAIAN